MNGNVKSDDAQANFKVQATAKPEVNRHARWAWVDTSIWTEPMLAALENGVKGGYWYSLMDKVSAPTTLQRAWQKVKRNGGSSGVDGVSIARFATKAEHYLRELSDALKSGRFRADAVKRVHIPKAGGGSRPLGIPAVKDRVVQTALKMVIEPIFEREFVDSSYGFRPGRGCKDALREVERVRRQGHTWVVDADIQGYFDNIDHTRLMARIHTRIKDGKLLALLQHYLEQAICEGLQHWQPIKGTPQGAVISPLLANLYLHELDVNMRERGVNMVRYADDFVILCATETEANEVLRDVKNWCHANHLTLHPDKTQVGNCLEAGHGFEFLGYRFEQGQRTVRAKSLTALKTKIKTRTRRTRGDNIATIVRELNPILRGWFNYFQHAHHRVFGTLDAFIRRRLRSILCKQNKLSYYYHRSLRNHLRWPNKYFAELGLFTLKTERAKASRSR